MDIKEQIRDILIQHHGKANRISSTKIGDLVGISENATRAKTRALILDTAKKYELALAANNKGYYIIDNESELNEYVNNLDKRTAGINERRELIINNFHKSK